MEPEPTHDIDDIIELCDQIGIDPSGENIRKISKVMRDCDFYINPKPLKPLVEIFGSEVIRKYLDLKRKKELVEEPSTLKTQVDGPNKNLPHILPT